MPYFIEIYRSRLHSQPLPLFNPDSLHEHVARFPQFLLKCFLAAVLPFSEHSFYDSSKSDAMEFYVRSAREAVIPRATEGTGAAELLQSLCLLTLSDIAGRDIP